MKQGFVFLDNSVKMGVNKVTTFTITGPRRIIDREIHILVGCYPLIVATYEGEAYIRMHAGSDEVRKYNSELCNKYDSVISPDNVLNYVETEDIESMDLVCNELALPESERKVDVSNLEDWIDLAIMTDEAYFNDVAWYNLTVSLKKFADRCNFAFVPNCPIPYEI